MRQDDFSKINTSNDNIDLAASRFKARREEFLARREKRIDKIISNKKLIKERRKNHMNTSVYKLLQCVLVNKRWILISLILGICGVVLRLLSPLAIQKISLEIIEASRGIKAWDFNAIWAYSGMALALYVGGFIFDYFQSFIIAGVAAKTRGTLVEKITAKLNRLPLKFFDKHKIGSILHVTINDVSEVQTTLNSTLCSLVSSIVLIIGTIAILFSFSWILGLVSMATIPFVILISTLIQKKLKRSNIERLVVMRELSAICDETYTANEIVSSFNATDCFINQFNQVDRDLGRNTIKTYTLTNSVSPVITFLGDIIFSLICLLGATLAAKSKGNPATIAMLVAAISYSKQLISPISSLSQLFARFQQAVASSNNIFDLLEEDEEIDESNKTTTIKEIQGNVDFEHVSFGYDENKIIIKDFNGRVKKGEKIAIVGHTGAGKTTLVNLLMRFYELNSGSIKIDGIDISTMKREYVRSLFGMVLQDVWLFEGTVMENLKFAKLDASDEEVSEAATATYCDTFIKQLGGYNAILKENCSLSSGQKQLLTIARAMVQNAPMLILDEATSSVDTRTEKLIQSAMDKLMQNRTSFVIAHRLSTIKNADIILVMDKGDVVESGTHEELLKKDGVYADLYNAQFANKGK